MIYKFYTLLLFFLSFYSASAQNINTIAGNGNVGYSGNGGQATNANLNQPSSVAVDYNGNIYFSEQNNHVIRKVTPAGIISTYAGSGSAGSSGDGAAANQAKLNNPRGIYMDANGNLYIADRDNNKIRMVNSSGIISTVAGTGTYSHSGDGGAATSAALKLPGDVTFDDNGNMYIADTYNMVIRKVNTSGVISTIAGTVSTTGYKGDGGAATSATFTFPSGIAVDKQGNIFVADMNNHAIRKINTSGTISTYAGDGGSGNTVDGVAPNKSHVYFPTDVFIDGLGNMYICEFLYPRIRKVNTSGIITTLTGNGNPGFKGDGNIATSALINDATGVTADKYGNVYIADRSNERVRKISAPSPEINVKGNNLNILDGDNSPSAADNTHFGNIKYPKPGIKTFKIFNTGNDTLRITNIDVTDDFKVQTFTYPKNIRPKDSLSFTVTLTPSSFGSRSTTITIVSNDIDEVFYDFSLSGIGLSGEIDIRGNNIIIADNDSVPVLKNNTDFGPVKLPSELKKTFKVFNRGNDTLTIKNINFSGNDSSDFKIQSLVFPKKINPKDSFALLVSFKPTSMGKKETKIRIFNNDMDESVFDFKLQGFGLAPKIVIRGGLQKIDNGDSTPSYSDNTDFGQVKFSSSKQLTFKLFNHGNDTLKIQSIQSFGKDFMDFALQGNFNSKIILAGDSSVLKVIFNPFDFGIRTAFLYVNTNDPADSIYSFKIQGTGLSPKIEVKGNNQILAAGDSSVSITNFTDFGISKGYDSIKRTFKIYNSGNDSLKINSIIFDGIDVSEFTIQNINLPFVLGKMDSTSFDVLLSPNDTGSKTAKVIILNSDLRTSQFSFALAAYARFPKINVKGNNIHIANGKTVTSVIDSTFIGITSTSVALVRQFLIINNGNDSLKILNMNSSGINAGEFVIESMNYPKKIAPRDSLRFKIIFTPKAIGNRSAKLIIMNDDKHKDIYNFVVEGEATHNVFINEVKPVLPYTIYPNPPNNLFYVKSNLELTVCLFNCLGQKVLEQTNHHSIEVDKLTNGIYSVQLINNGIEIGCQKIVISN